MFLATLIPRNSSSFLNLNDVQTSFSPSLSILNQIDAKTVYYPSGKDHLLVVASPENIPLTLQAQIHPFIYHTGFHIPVRAFQHIEYLDTKILPDSGTIDDDDDLNYKSDPEINRKLMAIRSQLAYAASELLGPDKFYFQLEMPLNDVGTRREYVFRLKFSEIPCYYIEGSPIFQEIEAILPQVTTGPLICSSFTLNLAAHRPPQWYLKEIFRDIVELDIIQTSGRVLIEGPVTGDLYLFYEGIVNVTEGQLDETSEEINNAIQSMIETKTFPRNTPNIFIETRQLRRITNGQWTLQLPAIPEDPNLFQEQIQISFTFPRVVDLFWFLFWLMISPTYSFIVKELQIKVHSHQINVEYYTKYYPDYLRVLTASRVRAPLASKDMTKIYYPERLTAKRTTVLKNEGPYIRFFDQANHEDALIVADNLKIPSFKMERSAPSNYSLETRLKYDTNPETIIQMINEE
jgi:hypothetical protein